MKKGCVWALVYCAVFALTLLTAHLGSRAVTVLAELAPVEREHIIIIDAGHGGVDGGATSCTGVPESAINLQIACRLEDMLHFLGFGTRMIRREDVSVHTEGETIAQKKVSDLKQRLRIASETEGAVVVSIHQNYYSDSRYSGAQVFYAASPESQALAQAMQRSMVACLNPGSRRQEKPGKGIYLMEKLPCTGILMECGFLSNPAEEAKLRSSDYQKALCAVIAAVLTQNLSNT